MENSFYERFMTFKPTNLDEALWWKKFGWEGGEAAGKRSYWKKTKHADVKTVLHIVGILKLNDSECRYLHLGDVPFPGRSGGGEDDDSGEFAALEDDEDTGKMGFAASN